MRQSRLTRIRWWNFQQQNVETVQGDVERAEQALREADKRSYNMVGVEENTNYGNNSHRENNWWSPQLAIFRTWSEYYYLPLVG
jgi:hypothetical protein